jgi:PPOX class probable F420-dependent enzyme
MPLADAVIRLATAPNLATVVTLMPDGRPQAQFTWIDTDGEYLLVNTEPQRQRCKNLRRDPRVTVLIGGYDPEDWVEVRGHLAGTVGGQEARDHADRVAQKYLGRNHTDPIGPHGRVILQIGADRVITPAS